MKILILANSESGFYQFRKELAEELINPGSYLKNEDHEKCELFLSVPKGSFIPKLEEIGVKFIETNVDRRGLNPKKDWELFKFYKKIIREIKPDYVFTYTIKPNIYGGIACKLLKVPYIVNITGLGTAIENDSLLSKVLMKLYRYSLSSAKTVFFQNETNKELFEKKKIVRNKTVLLPGSGVNTDFHNFEDYPEDSKISFLFVGRIMKDKGISELLDCAEYIKSKYPNAEFNLVGGYDEEEFTDRVNDLSEKNIIIYHGQQNSMHDFYKNAHAVIMPSYHEGMCNVLLEGASTGRPLLASDIPGCRESINADISGIFFEPKNTQSLIQAVEKFINMPYSERKQMGIMAREKIEKEFDRKIVIKEYLNIL